MKRVVLIIFAVALLSVAFSWMRARTTGMEKTDVDGVCVNTRVLDLGYARSNETVRGDFLLRNCGSSNLRFLRATPECTCTVADSPQRDLKAGQSMKLPISLQVSMATDAVISKRVGVTVSRDGTISTIGLRVVARIDNGRFVIAIPSRLDFGEVEAGKAVSRTIYLRGRAGELDGLPEEVQITSDKDVHVEPKEL